MARDREIIKAASLGEAIDTLASLYPTMTSYELLARRNERGWFSKTGHTFQFLVKFEEVDEPAPKDLGDDEY